MTKEEAINLIADMDSDKYTAKEAVALTMAIKALEQIDKIEKQIDTPNRGTCDYFIVDRIEDIIDKYKAESEEVCR